MAKAWELKLENRAIWSKHNYSISTKFCLTVLLVIYDKKQFEHLGKWADINLVSIMLAFLSPITFAIYNHIR